MSRWLALITILCLALGWILYVPNVPFSDQYVYHVTSQRVASGQGVVDDTGLPTAYWAPGYTFYLALFYFLFSPKPIVAYLANGLCYGMLIAGVFYFAKQLFSQRAAWAAALLTACYPTLLFYNTLLASEVLFSALLIWAFVLSFRWSVVSMLLSGIIFGCAILVRPQALIMPLLVFAIGWLHHRSLSQRILYTGLTIFIAFLTILPWSLRNQRELGQFVLVSANGGTNLWIGNHAGASGGYIDIPESLQQTLLKDASLTEKDQLLQDQAIHFILTNPGEAMALLFKRVYWTLRSEMIAITWNMQGIEQAFGLKWLPLFKIIANGAYYLLMLCVLVGVLRISAHHAWRHEHLLLASIILMLSLPFLIFHGQDRFHIPLVPYLILFVGSLMKQPRRISNEL